MLSKERTNRSLEGNRAFFNPQLLVEWNDRGYPIEVHGQDISVLLIGERHNDSELQRKQLQLIEIVKPEYVLDEGGGGWIYDSLVDSMNWIRQEGREFNNHDDEFSPNVPATFLDSAGSLGFKIIGCDLTFAELEVARRYNAREKHMVNMIVEYRRRSKRPIVVIVGALHIYNIRELLRPRKMGCVLIDQMLTREALENLMENLRHPA